MPEQDLGVGRRPGWESFAGCGSGGRERPGPCSVPAMLWGGEDMGWEQRVGVRDPVLRVGPEGCKLLVTLCCSPEINYLLRQKRRSCGVAEGVQIVEREAKRDGYHLFLLVFFKTVVKPSAASAVQKRGFAFAVCSPVYLCHGVLYAAPHLPAAGLGGGHPLPPWAVQTEPRRRLWEGEGA